MPDNASREFRFMFRALPIWCACAAMLWSLPGLAQGSLSEGEAQIRLLVAQLGAENYAEREAAAEQLVQVGAAALPALHEGAKHLDREIRWRCRRLVSEIAQSDLKARIAAFLAGGNSDNDYGLPFWKEFREEYGSNEAARKLFVEMQEHESSFLQAIVSQPGNTAELVELRSQQVQNFTQQENRQAPLGTIVALLSVAGVRHDLVSDDTHPRLFHFCHQAEFQTAIDGGPRREILRKMLGTLVREADSMWSLYYVLDLAMKYDLQEGLPQALSVVNNRNSQPHIRQLAILAIGKLGNESHAPALENVFDDASRTGTHSFNDRVYHQQVCDLALVAAAHLRGFDNDDLGLGQVEAHPYLLFNPSGIGFENEESRRAAFEKYEDLRRRKPSRGSE